ncbi:hypothetical protein [Kitasatospora sp. NPDC008115]|uniref:hypothetical protein n=1 Tax=Kitasatospora sp. NPDC008115 TaxID=3364022 RepID=UPI0036EE8F48
MFGWWRRKPEWSRLVDIDEFVGRVEGSELFVDVEVREILEAPRIVDLWTDTSAGQVVGISVAEHSDTVRVFCDGFVFDEVEIAVVFEFVGAIVDGRAWAKLSRNGRWLQVYVPTSRGVREEPRRVNAGLEIWEQEAIAHAAERRMKG